MPYRSLFHQEFVRRRHKFSECRIKAETFSAILLPKTLRNGEIMELQNFTEKIMEALQEFYGSDTRIETHQVYKNNGLKLQGVCVLTPQKNIAPTIYLNHFFEQYRQGMEFGEILNQIIALYEENRLSQNLDVDFFMDYHKVKRRLVLRLIHKEKNKELLDQIPYRRFHDLAIVCHCLMMNEAIGTGSILIYKHHLQTWGIDQEEMFRQAAENSPRLQPCSMQKMGDMLKEIMGRAVEERIEEICREYPQDKEAFLKRTMDNMEKEIDDCDIPMYVLTNEGRYYGAACLLYDGVLEQIGEELKGDFYILPSSVHEIILVARREGDKDEVFSEMVRQVNASQVDPQEWLSDHAYLYSRKEKRIILLE